VSESIKAALRPAASERWNFGSAMALATGALVVNLLRSDEGLTIRAITAGTLLRAVGIGHPLRKALDHLPEACAHRALCLDGWTTLKRQGHVRVYVRLSDLAEMLPCGSHSSRQLASAVRRRERLLEELDPRFVRAVARAQAAIRSPADEARARVLSRTLQRHAATLDVESAVVRALDDCGDALTLAQLVELAIQIAPDGMRISARSVAAVLRRLGWQQRGRENTGKRAWLWRRPQSDTNSKGAGVVRQLAHAPAIDRPARRAVGKTDPTVTARCELQRAHGDAQATKTAVTEALWM